MILTSQLKLDQYLDITIHDSYDEHNDSLFTCEVVFYVIADQNGLSYDVSQINKPHIKYTGVIYTDVEEEDQLEEISKDLSSFATEIRIEKSSQHGQNLTLDNVEIDMTKEILRIYFKN